MDEPVKTPPPGENVLVKIAGTIGMSAFGIAFLFIMLSQGEAAWPAAFAIMALAVMGIFMAHFATRNVP